MRTAIIVPKACLEESSDYEGKVEIRPPLAEERFEYFDLVGVEFNGSYEMELKDKNPIHVLKLLMPKLKNHLIAIDIKRKSDGECLKSYEDLSQDPGCMAILSELAMMLLSGFKPSKN